MTSLVVLLCVLLTGTLWWAGRLVVEARRRALQRWPEGREGRDATAPKGVDGTDTSRQEVEVPETGQGWSQGSSWEELKPVAGETADAVVRGEFSDVYADPIDGVPFVPGETVIACRCGAGYRKESVDWLAVNLGGRCVTCGCVMKSVR